jgi:poly(A) polymerase
MPLSEHVREELDQVLLVEDPTDGLWALVDSGRADQIVPELPALALEQDPIHRHKDVLSHTIAVTAKSPARLRVRLAALFHDVGKPATRRFGPDGVTFRHHEVVGSKMTRKRLRALEYDQQTVDDVTELVRLSGRFKGYTDGWSDSAVRRYARDAGHLLGDLNALVRSDCTTRNRSKVAALHAAIDQMEERIKTLAEADRRAAERPLLDGDDVMAHLGIPPGRDVGEAVRYLLDEKRAGRTPDRDAAVARLDAWWAERR